LDPIQEFEIDPFQPSGVLTRPFVDSNLRCRGVEEWYCPCRRDPDHDGEPDKMCRMNKKPPVFPTGQHGDHNPVEK